MANCGKFYIKHFKHESNYILKVMQIYSRCIFLFSGTIEKVLLSFSVYLNGVKILSTNQASGSLSAVNGIRFLSMAWVILGHSYFFAMNFDGRYDIETKFFSSAR